MTDLIPAARAWVVAHPGTTWGIAAAVAAVLTAWVVARLVAKFNGRTLSAKANVGFAAVQGGLAFITITGGYEFWHGRLNMPGPEAWFLAGVIEASVWACVGMIYKHIADGSTGTGKAGVVFWIVIAGSGLIAIAGSTSFAIATGRTVVVTIGAAMWYLRIDAKVVRSEAPPEVLWTFRRLLLAVGAIRVKASDVGEDDIEWQVRRLTRAIRRKNDGNRLTRWMGERTLIRQGDTVKAEVQRAARERYAFGYVIREEVSPTSTTMVPVIEAARRSLAPPQPDPDPEPSQPPVVSDPPALVVEPPSPAAPPAPVAPVVTPAPTPTPAPAPAVRTPAQLREQAEGSRMRAEAWLYDRIRAGNPVTGKGVGDMFGFTDQWGRERIKVVRARIAQEDTAADVPDPEPAQVG